ncbi:MAG TPA: HTTM domain-containing protein, partial [Acidimicrobiales bacterium]|nr:HTTM domain-containing protein [Acidimicrobiales bacterium]
MSTPSAERTTQAADATWLFGLFALLFALSLILHQLWWDGFEVRSWHFPVVLAALWVVGRPTSVWRFLTMIALETFAVALDMPDVGSHTLLVLMIGTCLLAYVVWTTWRHRRLPDAGTLFEHIAPFLGFQLLLVYAAAAVAKMNTGFFDVDISCATSMSRHVAWLGLPFLDGTWRVAPSIWGTVLTEAMLPVLLAVPRTRVFGLVVGGVFHAVLALAGNVPFSA